MNEHLPIFLEPDFERGKAERVARMRLFGAGEVISPSPPQDLLSIGIKTLICTPYGLKTAPTKRVIFEMKHGEEAQVMDMDPSLARRVAQRIIEMADEIEKEK